MKRVLITGGSGYVGRHLTRKLLTLYKEINIRIISRGENDVARLISLCGNDKRVTPIIGDLRDLNVLEYALGDADTVIHLAAMKHINLCEANSLEELPS